MLREVKLRDEEGSWVKVARHGSTYGVPNRVWLAIAGCLSLFTLSRIVWSPSSPISRYTASNPLLAPVDFLNASIADPAPFDFCPVFGPGDEVAQRRGQWGLLRSRLHTGSGARIQKVVQRALAGEAITISVLGGSVSACHGAGEDPISAKCYPSKFFNWWTSVFPHPNAELTNGAARKHDSAYFAYCSKHHLPDHTDLVILEFDTSDPNDAEWLSHFELLVRSILVRPDAPAVIILGHFAPQIQAQNGFAGPELLHTVVAQFYDVPHISLKGILYHDYMSEPEVWRGKFFADPMLSNGEGHSLIADLLISYMQGQICAGWAATMGHGFEVPYMATSPGDEEHSHSSGLTSGSNAGAADGAGGSGGGDHDGHINDDKAKQSVLSSLSTEEQAILEHKHRATRVPRAMLVDRPSDILRFREIQPYCVAANDLINIISPNDLAASGWQVSHPKKGADDREKHYWYATKAGSRLRVPIELSAGDVTIYYFQQPEDVEAGSAACWVDDNIGGATELSGNADVHTETPTMTLIDPGVAPGPHYVECMLLGPEGKETAPFKLLGVFGT